MQITISQDDLKALKTEAGQRGYERGYQQGRVERDEGKIAPPVPVSRKKMGWELLLTVMLTLGVALESTKLGTLSMSGVMAAGGLTVMAVLTFSLPRSSIRRKIHFLNIMLQGVWLVFNWASGGLWLYVQNGVTILIALCGAYPAEAASLRDKFKRNVWEAVSKRRRLLAFCMQARELFVLLVLLKEDLKRHREEEVLAQKSSEDGVPGSPSESTRSEARTTAKAFFSWQSWGRYKWYRYNYDPTFPWFCERGTM